MDLKGKAAIITGSAKGIGFNIALKLSEYGCNIVISDILEDEAKKAAEQIKSKGVEAVSVKCDVSKADDVKNLVETATQAFEQIHILVNNAGITRDTLLLRMDEKDWDLVMNINLKGTFLVTKEVVAKAMRKKKYGKIINIASVVGIMGNTGQANYSASKGGIIAFTKTIAREYAKSGIYSNAVAPGFIDTDMTRQLKDEVRDFYKNLIPMDKFGSVEDVANAVLFLASPLSDYITGQVISVNGGMLMP
ncbi:3-oxoacyl-[acyl-carrier-protein] reductase [Spirochaetota bacterium]